jgi:hypothetical protein
VGVCANSFTIKQQLFGTAGLQKCVDLAQQVRRIGELDGRVDRRLVQGQLADVRGQKGGFEGAERTVGVPEEVHRLGNCINQGGNIVELALHGVRLRVATLATTSSVNGVDREILTKPWQEAGPLSMVDPRSVDQHQRRPGPHCARTRSACRPWRSGDP